MRDIFGLVEQAVMNVFDFQYHGEPYSLEFRDHVNDLMGPNFYEKRWSDDDYGSHPTKREIEKLEMFAGPHGKTIYKAVKARGRVLNRPRRI